MLCELLIASEITKTERSPLFSSSSCLFRNTMYKTVDGVELAINETKLKG